MIDFNIENFGSSEDNYCTGYLDEEKRGSYVVLSHLAAISTPKVIGLKKLEEINAFDTAEVEGINFGQLNMIKVSSFCGPKGKIAGLDFMQEEKEFLWEEGNTPVYSARNFLEISRKIVGTKERKKFTIMPGSHVSCAGKYEYWDGPARIYSMFAVGVPTDKSQARLFMEAVGRMERDQDQNYYQKKIAFSVIEVFKNQGLSLKEIYIAICTGSVREGELGCALVMLPYIKLARNFFSEFYK